MESIDKFVGDLQEQIIEDARRDYSEIVIDHWMNPRNIGKIEDYNGYGRVTGSCGDTVEIYLRILDNEIKHASFFTDGCGITIACASIVTELVTGKSVGQVKGINYKTVLKICGGLPDADQHCVLLTVDTLQEAIKDYESKFVR